MDTKITAAIVDDEQGNRENLLRMIGNYCPQIRISAICSSVTEARTVLPEAKPDILFLDIRLGDDTGFSLLGSLDACRRQGGPGRPSETGEQTDAEPPAKHASIGQTKENSSVGRR